MLNYRIGRIKLNKDFNWKDKTDAPLFCDARGNLFVVMSNGGIHHLSGPAMPDAEQFLQVYEKEKFGECILASPLCQAGLSHII